MDFILWILFGALAGWIASKIMGTDAQQGWLGNIIVGVVGALVGGWLVGILLPGTGPSTGFNLSGLIVAILGAVVVLFIYNMLTGRSRHSV